VHELRKDPITGNWVVVLDYALAPGDYPRGEEAPLDEAGCLLCPGREAETGPETAAVRPEGSGAGSTGWRVRAVRSPRPILVPEGELGRKGVGLYDRMNAAGVSEIIVESPEHGRSPEDLGAGQMRDVLEVYKARVAEMERDPKIRYVLIRKSSGRRAGAAYGHPHSTVLGTPVIPTYIKHELDGAKSYFAYKERCIYCDILDEEIRQGARVIAATGGFVAFCPFAPRFAFEFWVMPRGHSCAFQDCGGGETAELGELMGDVLRKMRSALAEPSYTLALHTAPNRMPRRGHWHTLGDDFHWHIEVAPRLPGLPGVESGSRELTVLATSPEDAAKFIREA